MTPTTSLTIETFDPKTASRDTWRAYHAFADRVRAEVLPDDPATPPATRERLMSTHPVHHRPHYWLARRGDAVVASAFLGFSTLETNRHLCDIDVTVLADARGQGVASALLRPALEKARSEGKTHIGMWTTDRIGSGEAFLTRLGLNANLRQLVSRLDLSTLDEDLLRGWVARKDERAADFDIDVIEGPLPEERHAEYAGLFDVMNTAPRGTLEVEDEHTTPEQLGEWERSFAESGRRRLTAVAIERATGKLAGFTMLVWLPETSEIVHQWGTGVWPQYRDRGLGRVLKAENILRLLEANPGARFVRTSNAHVNAAMLGINRAMGFKPEFEEAAWQLKVEQLQAYLDAKTFAVTA
ncbi:GNAT family N-acetyltransferase [Deinococcus yavapaiensis]|uniref:Acetyltransferase (GNAT) family protein n=1 Tax=Deinococcus yavapaiensis KR-236 TaxID=694435 RepID=A0A318SBT9_9DEIO|nr:GNAT family N-acetyltransferase [Deinococcus yavapaiensis]PYE54217.1 acetyltransferase (GNAT) family protein [Deinococcus yavapaiensis KR-236]